MAINTDCADYINTAESLEDRMRRKKQLFFFIYGPTNPSKPVMLKEFIEGKLASKGGLKYEYNVDPDM